MNNDDDHWLAHPFANYSSVSTTTEEVECLQSLWPERIEPYELVITLNNVRRTKISDSLCSESTSSLLVTFACFFICSLHDFQNLFSFLKIFTAIRRLKIGSTTSAIFDDFVSIELIWEREAEMKERRVLLWESFFSLELSLTFVSLFIYNWKLTGSYLFRHRQCVFLSLLDDRDVMSFIPLKMLKGKQATLKCRQMMLEDLKECDNHSSISLLSAKAILNDRWT